MSKLIAQSMCLFFKTQREREQRNTEHVPDNVTVSLNGTEKLIENKQKASWKDIRVKVTQFGNEESSPNDQDEFVAKIVEWLSTKKGKHGQDKQTGPVAKKVKTANQHAEPSMPSIPMIEEAGSDEEPSDHGKYQIALESKNPMTALMRKLQQDQQAFHEKMQRENEQFRNQLRQDNQTSMSAANQKLDNIGNKCDGLTSDALDALVAKAEEEQEGNDLWDAAKDALVEKAEEEENGLWDAAKDALVEKAEEEENDLWDAAKDALSSRRRIRNAKAKDALSSRRRIRNAKAKDALVEKAKSEREGNDLWGAAKDGVNASEDESSISELESSS